MLAVFNLLFGNNFVNCTQDFSPPHPPHPPMLTNSHLVNFSFCNFWTSFKYLVVCPNSSVANSHFWQERLPLCWLKLLNTTKLQLYQLRCNLLNILQKCQHDLFLKNIFVASSGRLKKSVYWKICWSIKVWQIVIILKNTFLLNIPEVVQLSSSTW